MKSALAVLCVAAALQSATAQCPGAAPPSIPLNTPAVGSAYAQLPASERALGKLRGGSDDAPKNVSCAMRELAVQFSEQILGKGSSAPVAVAAALNISADCAGYLGRTDGIDIQHVLESPLTAGQGQDSSPGGARAVGREFLLNPPSETGDSFRFSSPAAAVMKYVDASSGNDENDGSESAPWATIARAVEWLQATPPSQRPSGATINLAAGTYVQSKTVEIPAGVGGASSAAPVIFRGTGSSPSDVVITGAMPLTGLSWQPEQGGVPGSYCTALPSDAVAAIAATGDPVRALHLNQSRYWPARWPNANPNQYCSPFNQPPQGCPGIVNADRSRKTNGNDSEAYLVNSTVALINSRTGATMATGPWSSGDRAASGSLTPINVTEPSPVWDGPKQSCTGHVGWVGPSMSRYLSDPPPFWKSSVPDNFYYCAAGASDCAPNAGKWTNVQDGQVHMYHPGGWGGWVFRIADGGVDASSQHISFASGGYQEARGGGIEGNAYYFANFREELDSEGEFYVDRSKGELCVVVPQGTDIAAAEVSIPMLPELLVVKADHVAIEGVTFTGTVPVYLSEQYVVPSGGDYSIDKRGAVHIDGGSGVHVSGSVFHLLEGTAVMVTGGAMGGSVTQSQMSSLGENGVALVGTCAGMDCTKGTHPVGFTVSQCLISDWGVWGKQTSAVFQSVARNSTLERLVAFGGPRNGINFNDRMGGGTVLRHSLGFNSVLETSDNGWLNTWDRQPYAFRSNPDGTGDLTSVPAFYQVHNNLVFRGNYQDFGITNNIYNLDNDDGSSRFLHESNVLVGGSIKFRDGMDKHSEGNLIVYPDYQQPYAQAFQVNGFSSDSFVGNTYVGATGQLYGFCAGLNTKNATATGPLTANNTLVTPGDSSLPFSNGDCGGFTTTSLKQWQSYGFDEGTTQTDSFSISWLVGEAKTRLGM